jgi:hypothetical protein
MTNCFRLVEPKRLIAKVLDAVLVDANPFVGGGGNPHGQ